MILVSVLYPGDEGSRFDIDYYTRTHIPLVKQRWGSMGLTEVRLLRGLSGADGARPPYAVIALLTFDSPERFRSAADAHGAEIFADIPRFTDVTPVLQVSEPLG